MQRNKTSFLIFCLITLNVFFRGVHTSCLRGYRHQAEPPPGQHSVQDLRRGSRRETQPQGVHRRHEGPLAPRRPGEADTEGDGAGVTAQPPSSSASQSSTGVLASGLHSGTRWCSTVSINYFFMCNLCKDLRHRHRHMAAKSSQI